MILWKFTAPRNAASSGANDVDAAEYRHRRRLRGGGHAVRQNDPAGLPGDVRKPGGADGAGGGRRWPRDACGRVCEILGATSRRPGRRSDGPTDHDGVPPGAANSHAGHGHRSQQGSGDSRLRDPGGQPVRGRPWCRPGSGLRQIARHPLARRNQGADPPRAEADDGGRIAGTARRGGL